jgi:hypothetical protein
MKAMGFKVLSTVIDDFFSFIIKCVPSLSMPERKSSETHLFLFFSHRMPLLHRLACFRDDVVFLILLYQMCVSASPRSNPPSPLLTVNSRMQVDLQGNFLFAPLPFP